MNESQRRALEVAKNSHEHVHLLDVIEEICNTSTINQFESIEVMIEYLKYAKSEYADPLMQRINAEINESVKRGRIENEGS